jgi:hypothetical protein
MLSYHTLLLFHYVNRDLDKPIFAHFGPVTPPYPDMVMPCPKDTHHNPSKLPMTPCFLGRKLSRGLVLSDCWDRPNCNIVLNCVGSSRRLLRQKLQDGKCIFFSESVKRLLCNIRQNGWCITRGMQPERRVLPLKSRNYNKLYPSPKAYCFSETDDQKSFPVVRILAWFS